MCKLDHFVVQLDHVVRQPSQLIGGPRARPAIEQSAQDDGEPEEHLLRIQGLRAARRSQTLAVGILRLLEPTART